MHLFKVIKCNLHLYKIDVSIKVLKITTTRAGDEEEVVHDFDSKLGMSIFEKTFFKTNLMYPFVNFGVLKCLANAFISLSYQIDLTNELITKF